MTHPDLPQLTPTNARVSSPATASYNCLAWAAGETHRWWQPETPFYWPIPIGADAWHVSGLIAAFGAVGFVTCASWEWENGFEKIALYAVPDGYYTHAARQLPSGKWTSKLGPWVDIEHDTPNDVAGGMYGEVVAYMRRPIG